MEEVLAATHAALADGQRMLVEYKPFEPAFYHTDIADWGMALELAPFNIRVNVICPGAVETHINESTEKRDIETVKIEAKFERPIPLWNHPAKPEQVAELALFLASDASKHITGTPVWIDGAQSLLRG